MKKKLIILLCFISVLRMPIKADEGMWLPLLINRLNYVDMKKMGLRLTAEEIYSVNNSSLKDAIIIFGGGCTGEIISPDGLILTNHHCGYSFIQEHSSIDHDYLTNGFWAMNKSEELQNENIKAKFVVRIEDVTKRVLAAVNDNMPEKERKQKIDEIIGTIESEASENEIYETVVESFFEGNEYYLFVYEVYTDVRLVGAPPSSIGKFGGDTDNWMWPRHTGDFSLFRVYTDKDGKPAEYSKSNIPMQSKYFLPISLKGVKKNDFAMILGFPGSTDRYLTSYGIQQEVDYTLPNNIKIRTKILDILNNDMAESDVVRIQYASKKAQTSNYWKNFIGQRRGLKRLNVYQKKKDLEDEFTKWVNSGDSQRKAKYGEALNDIKYGYENNKNYEKVSNYFFEAIYLGSDVIQTAWKFKYLHDGLKDKSFDNDRLMQLSKYYSNISEKFFKDYNAPTEQKLFAAMLKIFKADISKEMQPDIYVFIDKKYKGNIDKFANNVFKKSIFTDKARMEAFLKKPTYKAIGKDLAYKTMSSFFDNYFKYINLSEDINDRLQKGKRLFVAGLQEMQKDKKFYPDANFTLRLTYGKVLDYTAADAVHYDYYTTIKGVMEKEDPESDEFIVHQKLKELYEKKDFGQYADNGDLRVCFLTDNDITGGNSGSPVINGDGQLIGLAFDGNWEAMSGDIAFEPELQRTINVDIKYVLFIIDKFAGAGYLLDEMKIIK
jgi:V8-like Glu-specific endopeptidase